MGFTAPWRFESSLRHHWFFRGLQAATATILQPFGSFLRVRPELDAVECGLRVGVAIFDQERLLRAGYGAVEAEPAPGPAAEGRPYLTALASSVARSVPLPRSLTRGDSALTTHGLHPKVVVICSTGSRSQRNAARKTRPAIHPNTSPTEMPGCRVPSATCRRRLTEVRADRPSAVRATSPDVPNAISVTAERASTDFNVSLHRLPPIFSLRPGARAGAGRAATVTSWIAATTGSTVVSSIILRQMMMFGLSHGSRATREGRAP